jgi:hypothetical protein
MAQKSQQRLLCEEVTGTIPVDHPCARWFSSIERSVIELSHQVENVALDVKDLATKVISQEAMMKMWKEEFFPQVKTLPDKIDEEIEDHKRNCLANRRAQLQAEDITNTNIKLPSRMPAREEKKGFTIPKIVIYIGVVVGTAIAVGGYVLAYLFEKLQ